MYIDNQSKNYEIFLKLSLDFTHVCWFSYKQAPLRYDLKCLKAKLNPKQNKKTKSNHSLLQTII